MVNAQSLPTCHIARQLPFGTRSPCIIKGFINSEPIRRNRHASFIFKTQQLQSGSYNRGCCGDILVDVKCHQVLKYGQGLILKGNLRRPFNFKSINRRNYKGILYNQGVYLVMNVKSPLDVVILKNNNGLFIKKIAIKLRQVMEGAIQKYTSTDTAPILEAMLLGERRHIPPFIINSMVKSGTVHILVVSGFNVGIVTFAIMLFLKMLRIPRRIRLVITIPLLFIYCLLTGASTPVVRATIMAVIFIFAYLVKRQPDIYNSLGIAALFILGINPRQLFDIGFELSFASVWAIVYIYPKIRQFLRLDSLKIRSLRFLIDGCLVSFSAWLGTMGFVVYYFNIISPVTVLANLFIVPLASLITLNGFSLIVFNFALPKAAIIFGYSHEFIARLLISINNFLIKMPAAYFYLLPPSP